MYIYIHWLRSSSLVLCALLSLALSFLTFFFLSCFVFPFLLLLAFLLSL